MKYSTLVKLDTKLTAPTFDAAYFSSEEQQILFNALFALDRESVTTQFRDGAITYFRENFGQFKSAKWNGDGYIVPSNTPESKVILNGDDSAMTRTDEQNKVIIELCRAIHTDKKELYEHVIKQMDHLNDWFKQDAAGETCTYFAMFLTLFSDNATTADKLINEVEFDHLHNISESALTSVWDIPKTMSDFAALHTQSRDACYKLIESNGLHALNAVVNAVNLRLRVDQNETMDTLQSKIDGFQYPVVEVAPHLVEFTKSFTNMAKKHVLPVTKYNQTTTEIVPQFHFDQKALLDLIPQTLSLGRVHKKTDSYAVLLPSTDPTGLFIGKMTASCMHIGGDAEGSAVIPTYTSRYAGFIAIQVGNEADPGSSIKANKVKAGAYVWMTQDGDLVLDSYEYKGEGVKNFKPLIDALLKHLTPNGKKLFIGCGGKTPEIYTKDSDGKTVPHDSQPRPKAIDQSTAQCYDSQTVYQIHPGQEIIIHAKDMSDSDDDGVTQDFDTHAASLDSQFVAKLAAFSAVFVHNGVTVLEAANICLEQNIGARELTHVAFNGILSRVIYSANRMQDVLQTIEILRTVGDAERLNCVNAAIEARKLVHTRNLTEPQLVKILLKYSISIESPAMVQLLKLCPAATLENITQLMNTSDALLDQYKTIIQDIASIITTTGITPEGWTSISEDHNKLTEAKLAQIIKNNSCDATLVQLLCEKYGKNADEVNKLMEYDAELSKYDAMVQEITAIITTTDITPEGWTSISWDYNKLTEARIAQIVKTHGIVPSALTQTLCEKYYKDPAAVSHALLHPDDVYVECTGDSSM